MSLRNLPSLHVSRLRFFIAGQIQHRTVHRFLYTPPAQVDAPCRLEGHYAGNKKIEKMCNFFKEKSENCSAYIAQHYLLQSMMYNGNIQQNSLLCAESCVTEEFHTSPRFSPAFFHRDAMCCTSFVTIMHQALFFCSLCA